MPAVKTGPRGGSRSRRRSSSKVPSASDRDSPPARNGTRGTARQPWQRAETTHPRHRPRRRTGPDPWPAPSAVTPATHLNLSAPLTHPHPPVKKDRGRSGLRGNPGTPGLPRSSAEARSSAQAGRSGPHHARLDQARYKSRITIPSSRRITTKTPADPGSAVDPACPSAPDPPRQVLIAGVVRDTGKKVKGSAVPAMKVTVSAAMRARDVSRPRPEHLAGTEAAEASAPKGAWGNGPKADEVRADEADGRGQAGGTGGRSPVFS
jgi:hypothetical protein